ncbi:hypothetical protein AAE478_007510 [Parahypoxylon ruwenzoriense]
MASTNKRKQLIQELDSFLASSTTKPADIDMLSNYLNDRPRNTSLQHILPADEIEERLRIARLIQKQNKAQLTAVQVSIVMTVPLETLQRFMPSLLGAIPFKDIRNLVRIVLQKNREEIKGGELLSSLSKPASPDSRKRKSNQKSDASKREGVVPEEKTLRNETEMAKCLERDGSKCIVLETEDPDACHIIPFAINSKTAHLNETRSLPGARYLLTNDIQSSFNLLVDSVGSSDKAWNMLSMNSQLYKWWNEFFFAFKCLGIMPQSEDRSTIRLQFCWMQQTGGFIAGGKGNGKGKQENNHWSRKIDLNKDEGKELVENWKTKVCNNIPDASQGRGGIVSVNNAASSRLVLSGRTLDIQMATEDIKKMKTMVDLQWACIQIATMSGAAGCPDFLIKDDEDDYNDACLSAWFAGEPMPSREQYAAVRPETEDYPVTSSEIYTAVTSPDMSVEDLTLHPWTAPKMSPEYRSG